MRLAGVAVLYALVGVGCAAARAINGPRSGRVPDALLLICAWPLVAPFLLGSRPLGGPAGQDSDFLAALERAASSPLGCLLPDRAAVRRLGERLRMARARVREIRALLAQPEFSEEAACRRHDTLIEAGDRQAAATAMGRLQKIRYIRDLGDRFQRELDQIGELLVQLRLQAEVVRLAGDVDGTTRELTAELLTRIEGIDRALEEPWATATPS